MVTNPESCEDSRETVSLVRECLVNLSYWCSEAILESNFVSCPGELISGDWVHSFHISEIFLFSLHAPHNFYTAGK